MNLQEIEKKLDKIKKLRDDLDNAIARKQGKIESIFETLNKNYGIKSLEEAEEKLEKLQKVREELELEIADSVKTLEEKYGVYLNA